MLYTYNIKYFKFALANIAQVKRDFSGGNAGIIFINGLSLKEIYKKMDLVVETADNLHDDNLSKILKEYCFKNIDENQFSDWEKLAQTLFHQGGLLNAFEAALSEKMRMPDNDSQCYIPQKIKKAVRISFANQRLTIQENFAYKKIQNSLEEGNYQLNAQVIHHVSLNAEKKEFLYQMELPVFKCQNSKLQKFLQQERLSIREIFNIIINKIFRIPFLPNRSSFFQNPYHQVEIGLDKITKKESNNNILDINWETIKPTN